MRDYIGISLVLYDIFLNELNTRFSPSIETLTSLALETQLSSVLIVSRHGPWQSYKSIHRQPKKKSSSRSPNTTFCVTPKMKAFLIEARNLEGFHMVSSSLAFSLLLLHVTVEVLRLC